MGKEDTGMERKVRENWKSGEHMAKEKGENNEEETLIREGKVREREVKRRLMCSRC